MPLPRRGPRRGAPEGRPDSGAVPQLHARELHRPQGRARLAAHGEDEGDPVRRGVEVGPLRPPVHRLRRRRQDAPRDGHPAAARRGMRRPGRLLRFLGPPRADQGDLLEVERGQRRRRPRAVPRGGPARPRRARRAAPDGLGARRPLRPHQHALQPPADHDRDLELRRRPARRRARRRSRDVSASLVRSRLHEMCVPVLIEGDDYRKKQRAWSA